jgi:exonuclease III
MDSTPLRDLLFLFWNVRGLGDPAKCGVVKNAVLCANPSVACLQETKLDSLDAFKLKTFLPPRLCGFVTADADGSRGGMVTAWDTSLLQLVASSSNAYCLTTVFMSTTSGLSFTVTNVYAPSDHSQTHLFCDAMLLVPPSVVGPWLCVGDFNLLRCPADKNNSNFDRNLAATFNSLIRDMAWGELPLLDRLYTWTNNQNPPVLARLDQVFIDNTWSGVFPHSFLTSLPRPTSDHVPLLVTASTSIPRPPLFVLRTLGS